MKRLNIYIYIDPDLSRSTGELIKIRTIMQRFLASVDALIWAHSLF